MPYPTGEAAGAELVAQQGAALRAGLPHTAFSAEVLRPNFVLPRDLAGKTMLDIAAGCSDFVCWLGEQGAQPVGVDVGYSDLDTLVEEAKRFVEEEQRDRLASAAGASGLTRAMALGQRDRQVVTRFQQDVQTHPDRYVAADASALKFADDTFDHVVSYSFFTSEPGLYREFLLQCVDEALRVLSPGGTFHMSPLTSHGKSAIIRRNIEAAVEANKRRGMASRMDRLSVAGGKMLTFVVTKPR
jgi:ubiquinone/menaquinone biosynthesis C-methylase UbiE